MVHLAGVGPQFEKKNPINTKIGSKVAHPIGNMHTSFKVKK